MKTKVVHELRVGLLVLKIKRVRSNGSSLHVISIGRLYRNGELWHESTRFSQDDIPFMRHLLDEAHTWMLEQSADEVESENGSLP